MSAVPRTSVYIAHEKYGRDRALRSSIRRCPTLSVQLKSTDVVHSPLSIADMGRLSMSTRDFVGRCKTLAFKHVRSNTTRNRFALRRGNGVFLLQILRKSARPQTCSHSIPKVKMTHIQAKRRLLSMRKHCFNCHLQLTLRSTKLHT